MAYREAVFNVYSPLEQHLRGATACEWVQGGVELPSAGPGIQHVEEQVSLHGAGVGPSHVQSCWL